MHKLRPKKERVRTHQLNEYEILDASSQRSLDDIVELATLICRVPMASIAWLDRDRERLIANKGLTITEYPSQGGFCEATIHHSDILTVFDAQNDVRFSNHPWVKSEPYVRFFAGVPVRVSSGAALGALGVFDTVSRALDKEQYGALQSLARQAETALELKLRAEALAEPGTEASHDAAFVKGTEKRLINSERFARAVLGALSKHFYVLDGEGNLSAGNEPWMSFDHPFDQGAQQTLEVGQNFLAFLETDTAKKKGGRALADGVRTVLNGERTSFELEFSFRSQVERHWFKAKVILFPDQELGRAIVIYENVSEHKRLEHRFRQAVESAPNALLMVNASGAIEMVNAQAEALFGYLRQDLIGQPVEMLIPERFRGDHAVFRRAYFEAPKSRPMGLGRDLFALRKDGSEFPVEIGLGVIDEERSNVILCSIVDIAERKSARDKLMQTLNEKEMLLKEVYHRVKNNLQVVSSLINLQTRRVTNPATVDLLKQSADRIKAMALLHEKLYQSKDLARIDFNVYIRSLVDHLLFGYDGHSGRIKMNLAIDPVVLGVDTAIPCGLIINELLSNALKHAFPDERPGEIGILFKEDQGAFLLKITDNGVGFASDLDMQKSASLGLQLVATLVNQLMGSLTLDRTEGTQFIIRFSDIS